MNLPAPVLEDYNGITVVRDDLLPGGTKRRAVHALFTDATTYVYASPVFGFGQLALAYAARDYNKHAVIFCAKRKTWHPLTKEAADLGATIIEVPMGFLSNVSAKAAAYAREHNAVLLPFGLDAPAFIETLADVARALPVTPTEVWSITSSGVLTRALQLAWSDARFFGVRVGHDPGKAAGRAIVFRAPERFEDRVQFPPPFPSNANYDAKAWRFVLQGASPGALFWNVA